MRAFYPSILTLLLLCSCSTGEEVSRRRGDVLQTARSISPVAYAWYARGRHHETLGDFTRAERDFRAAVRSDPQSSAAWAALGRVACRRGLEPARRLFERGLAKADRAAPILEERGLCRIAHAGNNRQKLVRACEDLREAMTLEPHKRAMSEGYAGCLEESGQRGKSARIRRAARLYLGKNPSDAKDPTLEQVDRALRAEDLEGAQQGALTLMSPGSLAVRAWFHGKAELAAAQAQLVLDASPSDPDAMVTMMALGRRNLDLPQSLDGLSDVGVVLLALVLRRHAPPRASRQFLDEYRKELEASSDPLVRSALARYSTAEY